MSNSLQPHGLWPIRFLCPWDYPGRNTGVGSHSLLQGIFLTQGLNSHLVHLLHWQVSSLPLTPPGKPFILNTLRQKETRNSYMDVDIFCWMLVVTWAINNISEVKAYNALASLGADIHSSVLFRLHLGDISQQNNPKNCLWVNVPYTFRVLSIKLFIHRVIMSPSVSVQFYIHFQP